MLHVRCSARVNEKGTRESWPEKRTRTAFTPFSGIDFGAHFGIPLHRKKGKKTCSGSLLRLFRREATWTKRKRWRRDAHDTFFIRFFPHFFVIVDQYIHHLFRLYVSFVNGFLTTYSRWTCVLETKVCFSILIPILSHYKLNRSTSSKVWKYEYVRT